MYKIGLDIGGTKCAVILGEVNGSDIKFIGKSFFTTIKDNSYKTTLSKTEDEINELISDAKLKISDISSIGISCGGPLDSKKGVIMSPPNLIGWDDVHIVEHFENKYKIRTILENDANACALAEWKFGAAKDKNLKNVIFLTFGTGFGAGLILDGKLYSGTNGMAGEIGHIRAERFGPVGYGKAGSFEGFCSGGGIAQIARTKLLELFQTGQKASFCGSIGDIDKITAKDVADAAKNGDELALEIYNTAGEYLGYSLSLLIDLLNPEMIIIGSIYKRCEDLLKTCCEKIIKKEALAYSLSVCKIAPAVLGDDIGLYAALALE
ncbi:MAG: ROK family protein [Oscillospiraceae bacterium]|nr:ROK family protein [Oscillospiraceae bacterium]